MTTDLAATHVPSAETPSCAAAGPALAPAAPINERIPPVWAEYNQRVRSILEKDLFFVVGCQKSGTTWVMKLLAAHPQIACSGETCLWPALLPLLRQALSTYNAHQRGGSDAAFTDAQLEYLFTTSAALVLGNLLGDAQLKCLGEKTPEHAVISPLLARLLPRAKFIHIIRDGRDAAISGWFQNLRLKGEAFKNECPTLADYVALFVRNHWASYIQAARSVGTAHPDRYFEMRYEDLHTKPEPIVSAMLRFLGVDAAPSDVADCLGQSSFERCSGGRSRGVADPNSFYRKGVVGDWHNHFDDAALRTFEAHGGALARELGYAEMAQAAKT